jgi:magnesium-transporting ATPase (P-type)
VLPDMMIGRISCICSDKTGTITES